MVKCSFCAYEMSLGTGKMYVKKDGKIHYFCGTKCEKNLLKLNRKPREHKWTGEYQKKTVKSSVQAEEQINAEH